MIKLIDIIYEENRYKKETGKVLPRWKELLQKYEAEKKYYVHFSNIPRVGLYLINKYETPIGFYAYPLDFEKMSSFATNRPYAIIFQIKPEVKILDFKNYSKEQYASDLKKLKTKYKIKDNELDFWINYAIVKTSPGFLWNITRNLSLKNVQYTASNNDGDAGGGTTGKWTSILYKDLGYDCVIDDCLEIIHSSEPCQAIFFNTNVIDVVDIIDLSKSKIKNRNSFTAESISFYGQNLKGKDFSNKKLGNANFKKANLQGANFTDTNLYYANFEGADLRGVNLQRASFASTNFKNTNLQNTNLQNTNLLGAYFPGANLSGANLTNADMRGTDLSGANLSEANLTNADMRDVNLNGADLNGANLNEAELEGANLSNANIRNAKFIDATYDSKTIFPKGFDTFAEAMFDNSY